MTVNSLASPDFSRPSRTVAEWLWPFIPMGIAALSLSALVYYHLHQQVFEVRSALQQFYAGLYRMVGFAPAVMFFFFVIVWSTIWLVVGKLDRPLSRLGRLVAMAVMLGIFLNLGDGKVSPDLHKGAIGAWFAETLVGAFGYLPSLIVVGAITFASLLLATDYLFHESFERMRIRQRPLLDVGVEDAVTEHLRGLAESAPVVSPTISPTISPAVSPAVAPLADEATEAPANEAPAHAANDQQGVDPDEPSASPSYLERRRRREERSWRRHDEDEWVPAAPESQEIDNPEISAVLPVVEAELSVVVAPDLQGVAAVDSPVEVEPSAAPSPVAELAGTIGESSVADTNTEPVDGESSPTAFDPGSVWPDELPPPVERMVTIPRPDPAPAPAPAQEPVTDGWPESPRKQQQLFGAQLEEGLVQEAIDVVTGSRRASVVLLQRKLRIDYARASELLIELAARGVIALEGDATHGRVLG